MSARPFRRGVVALLSTILFLALFSTERPLGSQERKGDAKTKAWTLEAARERLAENPNDPYLQYVTLMLAQRHNQLGQLFPKGGLSFFPPFRQNQGRNRDLFGIFTGSLAIQESLQLDTMIPAQDAFQRDGPFRPKGFDFDQFDPARVPVAKKLDPKQMVKLSRLSAPQAPSHPWDQMLGDQKPLVSELSKCVPEVFWFAEFPSLSRLKEIAGDGDVLGGHLFTTLLGDKRSSLTLERIQRQLGLISLPKSAIELLGIESVAVTGSDFYLSEGSDITVLIKSKQLPKATEWFDALTKADVQEKGEYLGVAYRHRKHEASGVDVYCAEPRDDLHLRSTSLPAFKKVLEAVVGKTVDGSPTKRLGESAEFRYIRTILPSDPREEDGFIYLSDAFIHHLVGPELKIREARRIRVYNHLKMIGHAALLFHTEFTRPPKSLQELSEKRCAPGVFGKDKLAHPDDGTYSLSADGMSGVCSKYGTVDRFASCLEHPITEATREEAEGYHRFVQSYDEYWRTFFDPIVVRMKATDKEYRLETLILPLIDNSIYTSLAAQVGGKPRFLDALPTPKSEAGGIWMAFNKQSLLDLLPTDAKERAKQGSPIERVKLTNAMKLIGLAMHDRHDSFNELPSPAKPENPNRKHPVSWRVLMLPYLEGENLYRQYNFDEPWDSETNKKLIASMPKVYAGTNQKLNDEHKTTLMLPVGKGMLYPKPDAVMNFARVTDGLSNTIMVYRTADENAVVWTKPEDFPLDATKLPNGIGREKDGSFLFLMGDGAVQRVEAGFATKKLQLLFDPNDGMFLDLNAKEVPPRPRTEDAKPNAELAADFESITVACSTLASGVPSQPKRGFPQPPQRFPPKADWKDPSTFAFQPTLPKNAKLSWRVAILPHVGETELYQQFKLDQTWDSEHNQKLLSKMPRIYMGTSKALNSEGKTQFVLPTGKGTAFPTRESKFAIGGDPRSILGQPVQDWQLRQMGMEQFQNLPFTITHVIATEAKAVPWTKPDDLEIDLKNPTKDLYRFTRNSWLLSSTTGLKHLSAKLPDENFARLLDPKQSAEANVETFDLLTPPSSGQGSGDGNDLFSFGSLVSRSKEIAFDPEPIRKFLRDGIGDQIGIQLHDSAPILEFNPFAENQPFRMGVTQSLSLNLLVQLISRPVSISVPVKDAKTVDEYLDFVDRFVAESRKATMDRTFFDQTMQIYRVQLDKTTTARAMTLEVFGFKYRLFWARIGTGLYLTNRWGVLEQIAAAQKEGKVPPKDRESAHLALRLRPENWKEILFGFRLSLGESERSHVYEQLTMLNNVYRGWHGGLKPGSEPDAELLSKVARVYGRKVSTASGTRFVLNEDGSGFVSTAHGTPSEAKQPDPRDPNGSTEQFLKSLGGVRASLTLDKEALRATVVIERK